MVQMKKIALQVILFIICSRRIVQLICVCVVIFLQLSEYYTIYTTTTATTTTILLCRARSSSSYNGPPLSFVLHAGMHFFQL